MILLSEFYLIFNPQSIQIIDPQIQLKLLPKWVSKIEIINTLLNHALLVLVEGGFLWWSKVLWALIRLLELKVEKVRGAGFEVADNFEGFAVEGEADEFIFEFFVGKNKLNGVDWLFEFLIEDLVVTVDFAILLLDPLVKL